MTTAEDMILAHSGQTITRAQARELAALARALAVLGDPAAVDLLEFAKASAVLAKGRPAARARKERHPEEVKSTFGETLDNRPLHEFDPSYWGVMRPVLPKLPRARPGDGEMPWTGPREGKARKIREGRAFEPPAPAGWYADLARDLAASLLERFDAAGMTLVWVRRIIRRGGPRAGIAAKWAQAIYFAESLVDRAPKAAQAQEFARPWGTTGHRRGYFCGRLLGPERVEESDKAVRVSGTSGYLVPTGYDAADVSAELEADAMELAQAEQGASFIDDAGAVLGSKPRGKRLNGSRRDRRNLKPGQSRRAKTARRVARYNGRLSLERAVAKREPRELSAKVLARAMAALERCRK